MIDGSEHRPGVDAEQERQPSPPGPVSRYDLLLSAIPAAFVASVVAGRLLSVPTRVSVVAAAALSALVLVDALFLNPPRRPGRA